MLSYCHLAGRQITKKVKSSAGGYPPPEVKRLDQSRLLTAAHAAAWVAPLEETASSTADKQAIRFQAQMIKICDVSMPRVKRVGQNSVYRWSPELAKEGLCHGSTQTPT